MGVLHSSIRDTARCNQLYFVAQFDFIIIFVYVKISFWKNITFLWVSELADELIPIKVDLFIPLAYSSYHERLQELTLTIGIIDITEH